MKIVFKVPKVNVRKLKPLFYFGLLLLLNILVILRIGYLFNHPNIFESLLFHRAELNVTVLKKGYSDSIFFIEPGDEKPYKLCVDGAHHECYSLYATDDVSNRSSWVLEDDCMFNTSAGTKSIDDIIKVNGTYYLYHDRMGVWTSTNLSGPWEQRSQNLSSVGTDCGAFYEDGVFHLYCQEGIHANSGKWMRHYYSTNGYDNWVIGIRAADGMGYGLGDASIIKVNDLYYMFLDSDQTQHPDYKVAVYTTDNLYDYWDFKGYAMSPRKSNSLYLDEYGVQDPTVKYVPEEGKFYMFCNAHSSSDYPSAGITYYVSKDMVFRDYKIYNYVLRGLDNDVFNFIIKMISSLYMS